MEGYIYLFSFLLGGVVASFTVTVIQFVELHYAKKCNFDCNKCKWEFCRAKDCYARLKEKELER